TPALVAELTQLVGAIDAALAENRHGDYVALNQRFHFAIYRTARSPRLLRIIENLWGEVGVYMNELFAGSDFGGIANDAHHAILSRLVEGDAAGVRAEMVRDITVAADAMLPRIRELAQGGGQAAPRTQL